MRAVMPLLVLTMLVLCAGCKGGGFTPEEEAEASGVFAVQTSGELRAYGSPGAADPGTTAYVMHPYTGEAVVDADGSFTISIELPTAGAQQPSAAQASQMFMAIRLSYTRDGVDRLATATVTHLADYITKPLFSTGAGPNDMVFGLDSLYVANTFDNTVVRFGLDGAELDSVSFGEFASPSYLGFVEGITTAGVLFSVNNGDNIVREAPADDLGTTLCEEVLPWDDVFVGPGQPGIAPGLRYVPVARISSFNPVAYGPGMVTKQNTIGVILSTIATVGKNPQFTAVDLDQRAVLVVSVGEIVFNESFVPHPESPSFLEAYSWNPSDSPDYPHDDELLYAIELGEIGAGRIALDENTGTAYLGNSLNGNLYKVDYANGTVLRGISNPIVLTEEFTYISDVAYTPDGRYVLATSFNTDELYVIDTATDTVNPGPYPAPFDMSLDPELMAGCANVEIDPTPRDDGGYNAYVLYGVANAVAKVELIP